MDTVQAAVRVFAATYANNQNYYNQWAWRSAGPLRAASSRSPAEPLFRTAAAGIAAFLQSSKSVKESAIRLRLPDTSAFRSRTAASSDEESVTATAARGAPFRSYQVRVDQAATAQANAGAWLSESAETSVQAGTNRFRITVDGTSTVVSAYMSEGDTNGMALAKLKNAINRSNAGVTAKLAADSAMGGVRLELTGRRTGAERTFSVEDESGNAIAATGIGSVLRSGSDAVYAIDGGPRRKSDSNAIMLDGGNVTVSLWNATAEEGVRIEVRPDEAGAIRQVKGLVADYNAMVKRAADAGGFLNDSARRILAQAVEGTEGIGIARHADGTLSFDEATFAERLKSQGEQTRAAVSGPSGLAAKLSDAASKLDDVAPAALLNTKTASLQPFAAYRPYTGFYLQMPTAGLLFDRSY